MQTPDKPLNTIINRMNRSRLSQRHIIVFSAVIFCFSLIYFYVTRFTVGPDDINYIRYASYIVNDQGRIPENALVDLSHVNYSPIVGYPWGTSLALALFSLTGVDMLVSFAIINALTVAFFYLISIKLLNYLQLTTINLLIYSILSLPVLTIIHYNYISDNLSLLFYYTGIYMAIRYMDRQRLNAGSLLVFGIILFLPAFFRYAYYPLVYILPCAIFLKGYRNKSKMHRKRAIILTLIISLLLAGNMVFEEVKSGRTLFLNKNYEYTHEGLYWENLLLFDGFALKTYFDYSKIVDVLTVEYLEPVFLITGIVLLVIIVLYGYGKFSKENEMYRHFYSIQVLFLVLNTLLMIILSLKEAPQPIDGLWTYVEETRYYSVSMAFVLIMSLLALQDGSVNRFYKNAVYSLVAISFLYSIAVVSRNVYNTYNNSHHILRKEIYGTVKEFRNKNSEAHIVFSSESHSLNNIISALGVKRLVSPPNEISLESNYYDQLLTKDTLYASHPVKLIVHLPHDKSGDKFADKYSPVMLLNTDGGGLYLLDVKGNVYSNKKN